MAASVENDEKKKSHDTEDTLQINEGSVHSERSDDTHGSLPALASVDRRLQYRQSKTQGQSSSRRLTESMRNFADSCRNSVRNVCSKSMRLFSSSRKFKSRKMVQFDLVEIREYGIILGDNPSCEHGPAIQLDWECQTVFKIALDAFEKERLPEEEGGTNPRRTIEEMSRMPRFAREAILRSAGFSRNEIQKSIEEAALVKLRRRKTIEEYVKKQRFKRKLNKLNPFKRFR